jgi:hypothetical protein
VITDDLSLSRIEQITADAQAQVRHRLPNLDTIQIRATTAP